MDLVLELRRRAVLQIGEILPVHHEDEVELREILGRNLTRTVLLDVETALAAGKLSPHVGRFADMMSARGRAVRKNHVIKLGLRDLLAEDRLGGRTAADVARAHKKNLNHFLVFRNSAVPRPSSGGGRFSKPTCICYCRRRVLPSLNFTRHPAFIAAEAYAT